MPRTAIFWHLTAEANVPLILQQGLVPRASRHGFSFPQKRIYLFQKEMEAVHMASVLAQRDKRPIKYILLKVDLRRVKGVQLHADPELPSGIAVYATQVIPSTAISQV